MEQPYAPCPGWHRPPTDTYLDLNDKGGFYTHCVEIKLANGTVVLQGAYPERPSCTDSFRRRWAMDLGHTYKMRVSVRCCDSSLCNGPNGRAGGADRWPQPALVGAILLAHLYAAGNVQHAFRDWRWAMS